MTVNEDKIRYTEGGVCCASGFRAGGYASGIKAQGVKDLMMIVSDEMCSAAAVYTPTHVLRAA